MKIKLLIAQVLIILMSNLAYAGTPLWTFTPLTATTLSVPSNGTAMIQYQITNQSARPHSLMMKPITGISQITFGPGVCDTLFTLQGKGSSCTLSLQVIGKQLIHSVIDGPIVCDRNSPLQCYKPSASNILTIRAGVNEYAIGGIVSGLSGSVVLQNNGADNKTVTSSGAFTFSTPVMQGKTYAVTVLTQPAGQTCTVTNGAGTVTNNVTNVNVTCVSNAATLAISVSTLALSVNDTGLNPALTGNPRIFTIRNTGSVSATNVTYSLSPALPSGTIISPASCGTMAPSSTCILTITPGNIPSAAPGDINPIPITLNISGDNTNTLTPTFNILTYGSVYQGGYVYAVNDSTSNMGSISGTVVTLTDQASRFPSGIIWGSNGAGSASADVSLDVIPGIDEFSTTGFSSPTYANAQTAFNINYANTSTYPFPPSSSFLSCDGRTDGACNSANIATLYNMYVTNYGIGSSPYNLSPGQTNVSYYAAGLCTAVISGYSGWYLPAICEMGPNSGGSGCSGSTQSIINQLPDLIGDPNAGSPSTSCVYGANCLAGYYWSSTETSSFPQNIAWVQYFDSSGGSVQNSTTKAALAGVRCSRALVP